MIQYATLEDTVYFYFASNNTSGSGNDGASAAAHVRLSGAAAAAAPVISPSPTLLSHATYPAGCYEIAVACTAANGFAASNYYSVFCTLAVDSQNPTGFVGMVKLGPVPSNVTQWLGTAAATPTTAGVPEVDVTHWLGTACATPTVAGVPEVDLTHVAGATTNVAALATNVDAILTDTTEIGLAGAGLTNINLPDQTMNITGNITGNLSGSVGSVTGAVGSVTGAVGSVTGAVGSVTAGVDLSTAAVDAIWDEAFEGSTTARQALRGMFAALLNKLAGAATTTVTVQDIADTKARITATVDADGNRSAVTLDLT